jgi:hypothetical protein
VWHKGQFLGEVQRKDLPKVAPRSGKRKSAQSKKGKNRRGQHRQHQPIAHVERPALPVADAVETWGDLVVIMSLVESQRWRFGRNSQKWMMPEIRATRHPGLRSIAEELRVLCFKDETAGDKVRAFARLLDEEFADDPGGRDHLNDLMIYRAQPIEQWVREGLVRPRDPVFPLPGWLLQRDELDEAIPDSPPSMEALLRTIPPWEDLPAHLIAASSAETEDDLRSASSGASTPGGQSSSHGAIASA